MRREEWDRWVAAVVGGGEEDARRGIAELPVATVRFLLSISLLFNPFSQCSLCTSGPAALTRPNPLVIYTHTQRYYSMATNSTQAHRRIILTGYKLENTHNNPPLHYTKVLQREWDVQYIILQNLIRCEI